LHPSCSKFKSNKMSALYKINYLLFFSAMIFFGSCKNDDAGKTTTPENKDTLSTNVLDTAVQINLSSPEANEKVLFRFQPEIGKTYYFNNSSKYTAIRKMDTMEMKATSSKNVKMKMTVLNMDAQKNYHLEFMITDAKKTIQDDSSKLDYQYGRAMPDKDQDVDRQIEDCLVNSPVMLVMNVSGEAIDMTGYELIIKKMKVIMQAATGQEVPDEYIAQQMSLPTENIENLFIAFPDTAMKIGESWSYTANSMLQGVPILITNKYTFADRKDGMAWFNLASVIAIDKDQLPKEIVAQMAGLKVNSSMKGTILIDEKTGWPQQMNLNQNVEIRDEYQGVTTYSKETGNTVITLTK